MQIWICHFDILLYSLKFPCSTYVVPLYNIPDKYIYVYIHICIYINTLHKILNSFFCILKFYICCRITKDRLFLFLLNCLGLHSVLIAAQDKEKIAVGWRGFLKPLFADFQIGNNIQLWEYWLLWFISRKQYLGYKYLIRKNKEWNTS